ncbi:MAG: hypothetical protein GC164_07630 [Phycisphaera sp.]|nr:hypothetical protein [Phycisphaera sp.]
MIPFPLLLAQASENSADRTLFEPVLSIFTKPDTLAHPRELLDALQTMGVVWATIFFIAGLVCLLNGYKFYKPVVVTLALLIGIFAGYALSSRMQAPAYIVSACLGLLMAVVCFPLMKYAVAVLGGLTGAFIGANVWTAMVSVVYKGDAGRIQEAAQLNFIGALVGLMLCGMLAFILFKFAVVIFTSMSGSTVAVLGGLALLLQVPGIGTSVTDTLSGHAVVIPLLVVVPALIGLILQHAAPDKPGGGAKPAPKPA